jgi:hypothetical protein
MTTVELTVVELPAQPIQPMDEATAKAAFVLMLCGFTS